MLSTIPVEELTALELTQVQDLTIDVGPAPIQQIAPNAKVFDPETDITDDR